MWNAQTCPNLCVPSLQACADCDPGASTIQCIDTNAYNDCSSSGTWVNLGHTCLMTDALYATCYTTSTPNFCGCSSATNYCDFSGTSEVLLRCSTTHRSYTMTVCPDICCDIDPPRCTTVNFGT